MRVTAQNRRRSMSGYCTDGGGFAYMHWREWCNPGVLRRGAVMLIRNGSRGEGDAERNEQVGDDLALG